MVIRTFERLLLLIIFLTPLIPAHFGFGYELIKVFTFLVLIIIAGLIFVYLLSKKKLKIHKSQIKFAALLFLVSLSITSFLGIHPAESLAGKFPYFQGLILYWLLFFLSLMVSSINVKEDLLNKVTCLGAVIVSLISIWQFVQLNLFGIQIPTYAGRVISTFGQPNLYSGFLLLALPFASQLKSWRVLVIFIISTGIILSFSKAATILLIGFGFFMIFRKIKQRSLFIFLVLFLFLNALTFSLDNSSGLIWDEVIRPLTEQGIERQHVVEKRIYIYPVIVEIFLKNPVFGFGLDSINVLYKEHFSDFAPELKNYPPVYFNLMNLVVDRSHNYFLDLLIFSGVLGLGFYLYLIYLLFKTKSPKYLKVFLVLYLLWVQFQVQSVVHLMLFWLIVGFIDKDPKKSHY